MKQKKIVFYIRVPPLFFPKNVDFVIVMQFLAILFKLLPPPAPQIDPIW